MPRTPKPTDHLDSVRHLLGTMPDHEVARIANSTPSIVGRYRRRLDIPAYEGYKFGVGQTPPSKRAKVDGGAPRAAASKASAPKASTPSRASGRSKLDPYRNLIGSLPDADIAARAGVTAEAVRIYRRRHGLGAGGVAAPAAQESGPEVGGSVPTLAQVVESTRRPALRRASRLDAYMDLVGTLADREVATMAGVTPENVRAFRRRHNIPARWRNEGADEEVDGPTVLQRTTVEEPRAAQTSAPEPAARTPVARPHAAAQVPVVAQAPAVQAPAAAAPPVSAGQGVNGYAIQVKVADQTLEYIVVAPDIATAALNAVRAVTARHGSGEITGIKHLGSALA